MTDIQDEIKGYRERILGVIEGLPEAGAIAFTKVHVGDKEYSVTQRAWTVYDAIATLKFGIDLAEKAGLLTKQPEAPKAQMQARDELGNPVVDGDLEPVMENLPPSVHKFTVREVCHDVSQDGQYQMLRVYLNESYKFGKYGITTFDAGVHYPGWKDWDVKVKYQPNPASKFVLVEDPPEGKKYASILDFSAS